MDDGVYALVGFSVDCFRRDKEFRAEVIFDHLIEAVDHVWKFLCDASHVPTQMSDRRALDRNVVQVGIIDEPEIDHATTIILEFGAGPLGYLGTSFVVPRATTVTVRGTGGTAINDVDGARMFLQRPQDVAPDPQPIDSIDTIADQLDEFVRSIKGETKPETGGVEGQEVVAVLETAIASSESRRPEAVADFR